MPSIVNNEVVLSKNDKTNYRIMRAVTQPTAIILLLMSGELVLPTRLRGQRRALLR